MHSDQARLDPVGRLRLPRRATLLRLATVAVLLLTAAAVLYAADPAPAGGPPGPATPATTASTADPATARTGPGDPAAGPARLPIPAGQVGVPVRMIDPASLAVLGPGDRVDLLAIPAGEPPVVIATGVTVIAVDRPATALLIALSPEQGLAVTAAPGDTRFAVLVLN